MDGGAKVPLTFQIYKGDQLLRTERLNQDIIKVGKLASSHLRLDDESVSRMHAVIEVTGPDEIYIIDLGSNRGTVVNGQKVNKSKLASGDEIILGDTRLVVTVGATQAAFDEATQVSPPPEAARAKPAAGTVMGMGAAPAAPPPPASPAPAASPQVFASSPPPAPV